MNDRQAVETSPYVAQIEKFAGSLEQISDIFSGLEQRKKSFTEDEMEGIFAKVKEKVCANCEKCGECWGENFVHTCQIGYEILSAADRYGNELNTEIKRKLQQRCIKAPRFLREMLEAFQSARHNMMWTNRMVRSRKGWAVQMDTFAKMIRNSARELEDSMVCDERLEKKLAAHLKKKGIRVLCTHFFLNPSGKYEVHVIARAMCNECVTIKELVSGVSEAMGRKFIQEGSYARILGREYINVECIEGPAFYTLHGAARIGKGGEPVCGDSFSLMNLPGGRECVALSDGMGSGEEACAESSLVIEMLEELLQAGFPEDTAIRLINATLANGREDIRFSTIDLSVLDLYTGRCSIIKAGASSTFIKKKDGVEHISSTSLPIGVLSVIDPESVKRTLCDGDLLIMVTDGVMDALPAGEQDVILKTIIQGTRINNPKKMAEHILDQVLSWDGKPPLDDMTVLVAGIWKY